MVASDWRALDRGTMRGFFVLRLPSGLELHGCTLHERGADRWIGLPAAGQVGTDGRVRVVDGRRLYTAMVQIADRHIRQRFQAEALAALDQLLEQITEDESR
jgi:hypothetical protein